MPTQVQLDWIKNRETCYVGGGERYVVQWIFFLNSGYTLTRCNNLALTQPFNWPRHYYLSIQPCLANLTTSFVCSMPVIVKVSKMDVFGCNLQNANVSTVVFQYLAT